MRDIRAAASFPCLPVSKWPGYIAARATRDWYARMATSRASGSWSRHVSLSPIILSSTGSTAAATTLGSFSCTATKSYWMGGSSHRCNRRWKYATSSRNNLDTFRCSTITHESTVMTRCGQFGGDRRGRQPASSTATVNRGSAISASPLAALGRNSSGVLKRSRPEKHRVEFVTSSCMISSYAGFSAKINIFTTGLPFGPMSAGDMMFGSGRAAWKTNSPQSSRCHHVMAPFRETRVARSTKTAALSSLLSQVSSKNSGTGHSRRSGSTGSGVSCAAAAAATLGSSEPPSSGTSAPLATAASPSARWNPWRLRGTLPCSKTSV
mmetsp:Transcript_1556/g.4043  ORF Transcript_1556/g.4043 Transcript_1556/m.4043 type:complete len:323 (-) Transcript_1556:10-978(-)